MQKRRLGQTKLEVSVLGLGTVKFGRNQGVKYPNSFELPEDIVLEKLLAAANASGINLLDTAPAYGNSEERLGKLLSRQRHQWVISTKVGEEFLAGESQFDFSPHAIQSSIERSLKRLKTDYLDIVLVHSNGHDEKLIQKENVFESLAKFKKEGKIRAFGMSTKTLAGGLLTIDAADVAMVTFNLNETQESKVIHYAKQQQKGIFIKKAFASGHLSASDSLRFVLAEPGISSVIIGTICHKHLQENVEEVNNLLLETA